MAENDAIELEQPRISTAMVANQKANQWVQNQDFYKMIPTAYKSFYELWVRNWLYWYDGYVPYVHGGQYGLLSTHLGTTIVNKCAGLILGGDVMFANARIPSQTKEVNGKNVGSALDFISNEWSLVSDFRTRLKQAIRFAFGGGFSVLKLNKSGDGELWLDAMRADRFYLDKTGRGKVRRFMGVLSFYDQIAPDGKPIRRYCLVEERSYEEVSLTEEVPVVQYKIFATDSPIQYFSNSQDNCVRWEQLPKDVRRAFQREYGTMRLNEKKALNGFTDLGIYLFKGSDDVTNVPQANLGESLLTHILTYLFEYDFCNTCFNTDMYLARGRVLLPKPMQSSQARGASPSGFDDFIYTKYQSIDPTGAKPEAVQFALRSTEWKQARDNILESIATSIGISTSTMASFLQDGSARTAREVSAEESATIAFVEDNRRRFEKPINDLIKQVLRIKGFVDDVEIRWSKAGMSNQSVLVEVLSKAVQSGLISQKKAHALFNYDDDEAQNNEDYELVQNEQSANRQAIFGTEWEGDAE